MRILAAHRLLIGTFVAFALFFSGWQWRRWQESMNDQHLAIAAASLVIAAGFGIYLTRLLRRKEL